MEAYRLVRAKVEGLQAGKGQGGGVTGQFSNLIALKESPTRKCVRSHCLDRPGVCT